MRAPFLSTTQGSPISLTHVTLLRTPPVLLILKSHGVFADHRKPELEENSKSFSGKEKDWLGDLDSNQDSQIQSQETESNQPPDKPLKT